MPSRQDRGAFPFLQLSGELRNLIYGRIFPKRDSVEIESLGDRLVSWRCYPVERAKRQTEAALLRTCKQIHAEAEMLLYDCAFVLCDQLTLELLCGQFAQHGSKMRSISIKIPPCTIAINSAVEYLVTERLVRFIAANEVRIPRFDIASVRASDIEAHGGNGNTRHEGYRTVQRYRDLFHETMERSEDGQRIDALCRFAWHVDVGLARQLRAWLPMSVSRRFRWYQTGGDLDDVDSILYDWDCKRGIQ